MNAHERRRLAILQFRAELAMFRSELQCVREEWRGGVNQWPTDSERIADYYRELSARYDALVATFHKPDR
jgi:hypothetical protein